MRGRTLEGGTKRILLQTFLQAQQTTKTGSVGQDSPLSLGVISLAEIGVEHLLSARLLAAGYRPRRDKY